MSHYTVEGFTSKIRLNDASDVSYFFASEGRGPSTRMYTSSTPKREEKAVVILSTSNAINYCLSLEGQITTVGGHKKEKGIMSLCSSETINVKETMTISGTFRFSEVEQR